MAKMAVLGMKAFYEAVIKDLQKKLLVEGVLLRALTCLNPLEQKAADSLEHLLQKMVKCTLALCHSNADMERSLSINKRMLTKQNVSMKDETFIRLV